MKKICITVIIGMLMLMQTVYASDFVISDISDDYTFTVEGSAEGQNIGLILTSRDISWESIANENTVEDDIVYFDEYQAKDEKYTFSFPLNCKSGIYKLYVGDENGVNMKEMLLLYTNPSENINAVEKLKASASVSKEEMKKVIQDERYALQFYMPLSENVSETVAIDAIYKYITGTPEDLHGTKLAEIYRKNLVVDGLNEEKIDNIDDYYAYLKFENANVDKWYNKANESSKSAIISAITGKNLSAFENLENKFIETMILERVYHPDGYMNILSILNDFQTKTGFPTAIINTGSCSTVAGKKYASYGDLRIALTEASGGSNNNAGGGSGGGSGSGNTKNPASTSVTLPNEPIEVVEPITIKYFNDIEDYSWAKDAIESLYDKGIIDGRGDGIFAPADFVTREEFAKLIVLTMDLQNDSKEVSFDDVQADAWYAPYVTSLVNSEVASGIGDNKFGVGLPISRQDMAVMIYRALKGNAEYYSETEFNDTCDISDYAEPAIRYMNAMGYITGYEDGSFRPLNSISRAETTVVLHRVLEN